MRPITILIACLLVADLLSGSLHAAPPDSPSWDELKSGPLPHWPRGGTPEPDPDQPLVPYAIGSDEMTPPTSGLIEALAEYAPSDGVLFRYSTGAWPVVVTDCVVALTQDPSKTDKAYVIVSSTSQQASATNQFTAAGADMSKVEFILMPSDSIWLRDYGPAYVRQGGAFAIVDSNYYILDRTQDNFTPTGLAEDYFQIPVHYLGLIASAGGNFLPGPDRSAYVSAVLYQYNPGVTTGQFEEMYQQHFGIDTLHIFPQLPTTVDLTGHIDMWMYVIDDDTVLISEFIPGSNPTAMQITEDAVTYMTGLGFEVFRIPDQVGPHNSPYYDEAHFTYTNSLRVNDRIFIPSYGDGDPTLAPYDVAALAAWEAAAPDCEIIPIPCYDIIWAAGAIHCATVNVPRRTESIPAAHVLSPCGGELVACGTTHEIEWAACDDKDVTSIDLHYSLDGGATFPHLIASGLANDGKEDWTVPFVPSPADQAIVKVVANDGTGSSGEGVSESAFEIRDALVTVYDFSTDAGVDRWGWGSYTTSWSEVEGNRSPATVQTEITSVHPDAYGKIAASDASGGDTDANRFVSAYPSGARESTHIFEFTIRENPELILDLGILWEGYGDGCGHTEMFVWDNVEGNWCDGRGGFGKNRFMANYAGNRDGVLEGHIRSDVDRYIDEDRILAILLYSDRAQQKSFHDYVAVTVTHEFSLTVDTATLSAGTGGVLNFAIDAGPANAGRVYVLVGSLSGTVPGLPLPGGLVTLPLNRDWFTDYLIDHLNHPALSGFRGTLDVGGSSTASLDTHGPLPGALPVGTVMHFAYALKNPWNFASNPVGIEVVP